MTAPDFSALKKARRRGIVERARTRYALCRKVCDTAKRWLSGRLGQSGLPVVPVGCMRTDSSGAGFSGAGVFFFLRIPSAVRHVVCRCGQRLRSMRGRRCAVLRRCRM